MSEGRTPQSDEDSKLDEIVALPIRGRVAFGLAIAETVVAKLAADSKGLALVREGLGISWRWVTGEHVRAAELAQYIDGPTDKNFCGRQEHYEREPRFSDKQESMIAALRAVIMAIAYAAREAYELEGHAGSMPAGMWEVTEGNLAGVVESALRAAPQHGAAAIRQVSGFLLEKYGHHFRDTMGPPVTAAEILGKLSPGLTSIERSANR